MTIRGQGKELEREALNSSGQKSLALRQFFFRLLAFGDVTGEASGSHHVPVVVEKWAFDCLKPDRTAIFVCQQLLVMQWMTRLHDNAILFRQLRCDFRWKELEGRFSQGIIGMDANEVTPSRVDGEVASFFVFKPSGVWDRVQNGLLPLRANFLLGVLPKVGDVAKFGQFPYELFLGFAVIFHPPAPKMSDLTKDGHPKSGCHLQHRIPESIRGV